LNRFVRPPAIATGSEAKRVLDEQTVPSAEAFRSRGPNLTPRGWNQTERFEMAWALVAATFQADVTVLANGIALPRARPENRA
jgi:hypothetical protein